MRIALCLSGQPRTWRANRDAQLAFFAGHEVDIFFHTWREGDPAEIEALVQSYRPRAWTAEPRPDFAAEKRALAERFPVRPPLTLFDMLHSVARSLQPALQAEPAYDLAVRARFDAAFDGAWSGEPPAAGEILVPDSYPHASGCNDQFAIGRPAEMAAYGALGDWLGANLATLRGEWLRPEALLRSYLEQARGLRLKLQPVAMRLRREAQADRPFAGLTEDPLFHAAKHEDWEAFAQAHFPDLAGEIDFSHPARTPLALDRALAAWAEMRGPEAAQRLFASPWPERLAAVESFLAEQSGDPAELDEGAYQTLRLVCAALLQRMDRNEPLCAESVLLHMLSDNIRDMRRADDWLRVRPGAEEAVARLLPAGGLLARAFAVQPPLEASGHDIWRRD